MKKKIRLTSPIINKTKRTLIQDLEAFFNRNYPAETLPSHGIDHHRRVWGYAKELLRYKEKEGLGIDQTFIQKLMIGCYLHDIGMSIDPGIKHGHHSREICKRFIEEQNLKEPDYEDLLSAIENHDDKDYHNSQYQDLLIRILSVADDLDAFGEEGIRRYTEIYRVRGIDENDSGKAICDNAGKRFRNFENVFSNYPALVEKHRKRYEHLIDFFSGKSPGSK